MQFFGGWVLTVDVSIKRFEDIERENKEAREAAERRRDEYASRWRVTESQPERIERDAPVTRRRAPARPKAHRCEAPGCDVMIETKARTCSEKCRQRKSRAERKKTDLKKRRS